MKSVIIFSTNVQQRVRTRLANSMGIKSSHRTEKYLGIPMASGRDKNIATEEIIDKVKKRLPRVEDEDFIISRQNHSNYINGPLPTILTSFISTLP